MTTKSKLLRMDNVLIVVDDLEAAKAFFAELGMELEGEAPVEGRWVDRVVGLNDVRADIAMMRTPDGHSRLELTSSTRRRRSEPSRKARRRTRWAYAASCSLSTTSTTSLPACAATVPNSSARSRSTRTSTGSASCVALRASSSDWPSSSAETSMGAVRQTHRAGEKLFIDFSVDGLDVVDPKTGECAKAKLLPRTGCRQWTVSLP